MLVSDPIFGVATEVAISFNAHRLTAKLLCRKNRDPAISAAEIVNGVVRPDFGHLEVTITVDDPKAYTRPWTVALKQTIVADSDLLDYVCQENEKDLSHLVGQ